MELSRFKLVAFVVSVLGASLVGFGAAKVPQSSAVFVLAAVVPVLIPLPSLLLSTRAAQVWIAVLLTIGASLAGYFQWHSLLVKPDPFALMVKWAYPALHGGLVTVLLLMLLLFIKFFQFRRNGA